MCDELLTANRGDQPRSGAATQSNAQPAQAISPQEATHV